MITLHSPTVRVDDFVTVTHEETTVSGVVRVDDEGDLYLKHAGYFTNSQTPIGGTLYDDGWKVVRIEREDGYVYFADGHHTLKDAEDAIEHTVRAIENVQNAINLSDQVYSLKDLFDMRTQLGSWHSRFNEDTGRIPNEDGDYA